MKMADLVRRADVLALAKEVTLKNGAKHRCIDATLVHEIPSAEPEREKGKTMRLIDADAIHYDILLKTGYKEHPLEWAVSRSRIDSMPTIDAVEVVRCKDCKHRYGNACD